MWGKKQLMEIHNMNGRRLMDIDVTDTWNTAHKEYIERFTMCLNLTVQGNI